MRSSKISRVDAPQEDLPGLHHAVVVAVAGVGDPDVAVQVVERTAAALGGQTGREVRDRIAAVETHGRQIGLAQVEREVVAGHRIVEIHEPREIEIEAAVAGRDAAVELAVEQVAVEPQRIVEVAVELETADFADDVGIGESPAHGAVDPRGEGRRTQFGIGEQLAQPDVAGRDLAFHAAPVALQRPHEQVAVGAAGERRERSLQPERGERTGETSAEIETPRSVERPHQIVGQLPAADPRGQLVDVGRRGGQPAYIEIEMRARDVRKALHRRFGDELRAGARSDARERCLQIGHRALDPQADVVESRMPRPQLRSEIGHVVRREARIAQRGVDEHLAQEVLVLGPRISDQRDTRNPHLRTGRADRRMLEADAAVGEEEAARELFEFETAPLRCRQRLDIHGDGRAVDPQVGHPGGQFAEVHAAEVDPVGRIPAVGAVEAEIHVLDRGRDDRQPEIALFPFVLPAQAVDDLLDVHLARRGLAQVELGAFELGAAEHEPLAEEAEARNERFGAAHVEQRVALVVLHVEILGPQSAEQPDVHPPDAHDGPQLP